MKKSAYTLAEIMIVVIILAVLTLLTTTTLFNSPKTRYRKVAAYSSTFYSHASSAYTEILSNNARNYTLENMEDASGDGKIDSSDLALYFAKYIGGQVLDNVTIEESDEDGDKDSSGDKGDSDAKKTNCNTLVIDAKSAIASYKNNAVCADFNNVVAGFVYDNSCSLSIKVKEFLSKEDVDAVAASEDYEPSERNASNLCGYIVYSVKDSKGVFKKDLFTIPLGKRSIK